MAASASTAFPHGENLGSENAPNQHEVDQHQFEEFKKFSSTGSCTSLNESDESTNYMSRIIHSKPSSGQVPLVTPKITNNNGSEIPIPSTRIEATSVTLKNGTSVDSALLSAMRDDRERVALLRCENTMIEFIKAEDVQEIDVGGAYNSAIVGLPSQNPKPGRQTSFQRCWLHRLADRFGIVRESISPEWIKLKKTPESAIPSQLLINLGPSDYCLPDDNDIQATLNSPAHVNNTTGTNNKVKRNKMKIMRRSASSCSNNSDNGSTKPSRATNKKGTLTDKEKAYAAARARIFNSEDAAENEVITPSQVVIPPAPSPVSIPVPPPEEEARPAAATMGGISKVTWRNRQQEENDPDFQRGVVYAATQQQQQPTYGGYYSQQQQQYYYDQQYYGQQQPAYLEGAQDRGKGRGRGREDFPALS
mmetsp:Transcript_25564/g.37766  ORF Transcript_25564/g.37766 Transcript_25564/m.37766 type:complete len:420 (-) Transcript_25564:51-1310(-)|eukprot:CAMPEP_0194215070 /NCGR_PEP_ID=MMETSP0156-20130528/16589_1 /TAXON_ID=33649 /ORGANISM="Thalassionema nitzschioides, Strain L26-B" /LENGTH=419 /DNA_ID=CAMNT_0038943491 /DNA_START=151 /DNA_END=1410 /DNA_ORIENTATION=+